LRGVDFDFERSTMLLNQNFNEIGKAATVAISGTLRGRFQQRVEAERDGCSFSLWPPCHVFRLKVMLSAVN
jgi:hypothetical protein